MAPLTRMRTDKGGIPNDLMARYYEQRATEGAPGIYNDEQGKGWKKIVNAVHAKGAKIFLQLWHGGRQSHTDLQPDGGLPIGPSAVAHEAMVFTTEWVAATPNREATLDEIHVIIKDFHSATARAKALAKEL